MSVFFVRLWLLKWTLIGWFSVEKCWPDPNRPIRSQIPTEYSALNYPLSHFYYAKDANSRNNELFHLFRYNFFIFLCVLREAKGAEITKNAFVKGLRDQLNFWNIENSCNRVKVIHQRDFREETNSKKIRKMFQPYIGCYKKIHSGAKLLDCLFKALSYFFFISNLNFQTLWNAKSMFI